MTWKEYAEGVEDRLGDLHDRVHRGAYRAQPSRRVYILKSDGRQRPLGVAVLEDKIVQQAVTRILNQIYETDFQGVSYGFRPGRSQHQALDALTVGIERKKVNWILDLDIRGFFDNLNHEQLVQYVEERIADPRMLRLIRKWLKAGVMEGGEWKATEVGTPQGSSISPLLEHPPPTARSSASSDSSTPFGGRGRTTCISLSVSSITRNVLCFGTGTPNSVRAAAGFAKSRAL